MDTVILLTTRILDTNTQKLIGEITNVFANEEALNKYLETEQCTYKDGKVLDLSNKHNIMSIRGYALEDNHYDNLYSWMEYGVKA